MMGRLERDQGQFFYAFDLNAAVPADHLVRGIDAVLDLGWVRDALAPHYSHTGRPSVDPELMPTAEHDPRETYATGPATSRFY